LDGGEGGERRGNGRGAGGGKGEKSRKQHIRINIFCCLFFI